jgi:hypothetical protein
VSAKIARFTFANSQNCSWSRTTLLSLEWKIPLVLLFIRTSTARAFRRPSREKWKILYIHYFHLSLRLSEKLFFQTFHERAGPSPSVTTDSFDQSKWSIMWSCWCAL